MRVRAPVILSCLACWPLVGHAAEEVEGFQVQANVGIVRDNNLFRLADDFPIPLPLVGIRSKSDTAFTKGVGIKYDKTISRQRVLADVNLNETTFDDNTDLDYSGYDGRLAWFWRVGNDWDGEASYRKRRTLGGFADVVAKLQDIVESDYYRFSAGYQVDARWRVNVDLEKEDHTHSAINQRALDVDSKTVGVGLFYKTPATNFVGVQALRTDREYPNRLGTNNNDHTEDRYLAAAQWRATGKLRLDANAGFADVSHDQRPSRDFSGFVGKAVATWDATGKVRVTAGGFRDVRLYEDVNTEYLVVTGVNIAPIWAVTSKVNVQGEFLYEKRDFRPTTTREDNFRLARLGVTYAPLRNVDLAITYETGERRSNFFTPSIFGLISNSYDYQAWFGTARISFY